MPQKNEASIQGSGMLTIPTRLITTELEGLYGSRVLEDMKRTLDLYEIYEKGASYSKDSVTDYTPADLRYKTIKALIDKEARFLFAKTPDIYIDVNLGTSAEEREKAKDASTVFQTLVDTVLERNGFSQALLKAAKDCFIGKRVALVFNINEESGIQLSFLPSLEFVYDVDPSDANKLTKLIAFYNMNDEKSKAEQRIYRKKYWLDNGFCYYQEEVFDGLGNVVDERQAATKTKLTFIPAWVILNDGLTGDLMGESEIEALEDYESWYSRMASADLDAERKGMNPIRYTVDAAPESTKGLSISAGAFWDISSDQNQATDKSAQVGVLDSPMTYSTALSVTLDRIKNMMYEQTAVPNVSSEALKGVVSSGKTLKAIYWDLIVRCDEKMTLSWRPAIVRMVRCIIESAKLYPKAVKQYVEERIPEVEYSVRVDNLYPLPEDEQEEKQVDLAEVNAQAMSRKSYMKKWRGLTDEEADEEIRQIALERQLLEDSFTEPDTFGNEDNLEDEVDDEGKAVEKEEGAVEEEPKPAGNEEEDDEV